MTDAVPFGSQYILGPLIGSGRMGRVYSASVRDGGTHRAIKILHDDLSADPDVVARFVQERQVLQSIEDRNVVSVHDLVVEGGRLGIVMELIGDGNLRHAVQKASRLDLAASLTAQILDGLAAIHAADVVHRDLKPENILVHGSGGELVLKLTDFGISRLIGKAMTRTTSIVGTPGYISPEVALNQRAGTPADVYAVGVILYELCCGQLPFDADEPIALLMMHANAPVPYLDGAPPELWTLLEQLLSKNPSDRPTAAEAAERLGALEPLLRGLPLLEPPPAGTINPGSSVSLGAGLAMAQAKAPADAASEPGTYMPGEGPARMTPVEDVATTGVEPAQRRGRRRALAVLGIAAIPLTVTGLIVSQVGSTTPPTEVASEPIQQAFAPAIHDGGVVVSRTWELAGTDGDLLRAEITMTNTGEGVTDVTHVEVIPKSVAGDVSDIDFSPEPDEILERDPVVAYDLSDLGPGEERVAMYEVEIDAEGATEERLDALLDDQQQAQAEWDAEHPSEVTQLAAISVDQPAPVLAPGASIVLQLSGQMDDGTPAPPEALAGVTWSSSNPAVVAVDGGLVTAVASGTATITVQAGAATATSTVSVIGTEVAIEAETTIPTTARQSPAGGGPAPTAAPVNSPAATSPPTTSAPITAPPTTRPPTTTTRPPTTTTPPTSPPTTPPPPPPPRISLARGGAAQYGYWYSVSLSGFAPGSSVTVTCRDSVDPGGFWTQAIPINGSGHGGDSTLCYSGDHPDHWVTGGGVESNHVTW